MRYLKQHMSINNKALRGLSGITYDHATYFLIACSKKAGSSERGEQLVHAMSDRRMLNANRSS